MTWQEGSQSKVNSRRDFFISFMFFENRSSYFRGTFKQIVRNCKDFVHRLRLQCSLNVVCWNDMGDYILSGSADQFIAITNKNSAHKANILSTKLLRHTKTHGVVSSTTNNVSLNYFIVTIMRHILTFPMESNVS